MSLSPKILDLLNKSPLFSGLSNEILIQYLDSANRITLAAGKTLQIPGDVTENIYIILSGRLRVNVDQTNDDPIAMFGEGESVGELSILNGNKAVDYIFADTNCELLCISLSTIWALMNGSHQAALNMLNALSAPVPMSKRGNHNVELEHGYVGLSHVDELTGLYSRPWMFKTFERLIRRHGATNEPSALMMVSIDQLDQYNQSYGLLGGDQAFRTIAQTVLTCLRPNDHSGRYYGKVLAIFMSQTSLDDSRIAGQRLLQQASQANIVTPSGDALPHVTVAIGLAEVRDGNTVQQLFEQGMEALKRAVVAGGNCIHD